MFQHKWDTCNDLNTAGPCWYHKLERSFYDDNGRIIPGLKHPTYCPGYEELIPRGFDESKCDCIYGERVRAR
jgi:hypothetical protein